MEQNTKEHTLESLISKLEGVYIHTTHIPVWRWSNEHRTALATFIANGSVTKEEVCAILHARILETARIYYERHVALGTDIEHNVPEVFAWAVSHGEFTQKELWLVQFDDGDTIDDFVALHHNPDLLEILFKDVMTQRNTSFPPGHHCCCCP